MVRTSSDRASPLVTGGRYGLWRYLRPYRNKWLDALDFRGILRFVRFPKIDILGSGQRQPGSTSGVILRAAPFDWNPVFYSQNARLIQNGTNCPSFQDYVFVGNCSSYSGICPGIVSKMKSARQYMQICIFLERGKNIPQHTLTYIVCIHTFLTLAW